MERKRELRRRSRRTGVGGGEGGGALEVAGLVGLPLRLVVGVHGPAGVALVGVRQVAALPGLNGRAVHLALARELAAHPVQRALVVRVRQIRLGDAPLLRQQPPTCSSRFSSTSTAASAPCIIVIIHPGCRCHPCCSKRTRH